MLKTVKRFIGKDEPSSETVIWQREWSVYQAFFGLLKDQPCTLGGKYSWLTTADTGRPLQIDIFYPKITHIAGVELAVPRALAIEVQSSLHDGKWNKSKRAFFKDRAAFELYTRHQEWKRRQIIARGIPFIEIDPSKDELSPQNIRRLLARAFGIQL